MSSSGVTCDCCGCRPTVYEHDKLHCKGCGSIICKSCQNNHRKEYKEDGASWSSEYCPECGLHLERGKSVGYSIYDQYF